MRADAGPHAGSIWKVQHQLNVGLRESLQSGGDGPLAQWWTGPGDFDEKRDLFVLLYSLTV